MKREKRKTQTQHPNIYKISILISGMNYTEITKGKILFDDKINILVGDDNFSL